MNTSGSWVNYSGTAEIVLAVALAALAAAIAYAGTRLRRPLRPPRPGRGATIALLAIWVLAIAALLGSVSVYLRQESRDGLIHTPAADPIAPVTFIGALVVFIAIIVAQRPNGWRVALGSAVVGAAAGPAIFEFPFDVIIMGRSHPLVDPALYRPLLFGALFLVDLTTLALVLLSPAIRVRRATLWCLAAMVALFAAWALFGYGYPSGPGPIALNMLSKVAALATALTLFLPRPTRDAEQPAEAVSSSFSRLTASASER
jgi:hypothetical protein